MYIRYHQLLFAFVHNADACLNQIEHYENTEKNYGDDRYLYFNSWY